MRETPTAIPAQADGTAETATDRRNGSGGRECSCPEWVLKCAHWDGQLLIIADYVQPCRHICSRSAPQLPRYRTGLLVGFRPCEVKDCPEVMGEGDEAWSIQTDDLPAAEAEFSRREALMLGREDA